VVKEKFAYTAWRSDITQEDWRGKKEKGCCRPRGKRGRGVRKNFGILFKSDKILRPRTKKKIVSVGTKKKGEEPGA